MYKYIYIYIYIYGSLFFAYIPNPAGGQVCARVCDRPLNRILEASASETYVMRSRSQKRLRKEMEVLPKRQGFSKEIKKVEQRDNLRRQEKERVRESLSKLVEGNAR